MDFFKTRYCKYGYIFYKRVWGQMKVVFRSKGFKFLSPSEFLNWWVDITAVTVIHGSENHFGHCEICKTCVTFIYVFDGYNNMRKLSL